LYYTDANPVYRSGVPVKFGTTRLAGAPVADTPWPWLRETKVFISLAGSLASVHRATRSRCPRLVSNGLRLFPQHAQSAPSQRMGYIPGPLLLQLPTVAANRLAKMSSHFDATMYSSASAGRGDPACAFTARRTEPPVGAARVRLAANGSPRAAACAREHVCLVGAREESRVTCLRSGSALLPTAPPAAVRLSRPSRSRGDV
jgi:hypothetical protein